jgi:hypothetical protein
MPERAAFVSHAFAERDRTLVDLVKLALRDSGIKVITGEPPEAKGLAEKVRSRIAAAQIFVALLTQRHKIDAGAYTTSPWVIEEKGYFIGRGGRPIVLLVEEGITVPDETGGLGGDLDYVRFDRLDFDSALDKLREILVSLR